MTSILNRPTAGERYLTILFLSLFSLFLLFGVSLHLDHVSMLFKISSAIADSALILIACMWLKGKWRYLSVAIPFATAMLLLANLLYYRNFGDMIQASSYFKADMDDPTVVSGGLSSMQWFDILYLILPFVPLTYMIMRRKRIIASGIGSLWRSVMGALLIVSLGISYAGVFRRTGIYHNTKSFSQISGLVFSKETTTWVNNYEKHNFSGYMVKCAISLCNTGMKLTPADLTKIKQHISSAAEHRPDSIMASHLDSGKGKNLIMIIVESLPFKVLDMDGADRIIPSLKQITTDSTAIVSKCRVLANYGRSSDAQFMYNTGLLPLRNEALVDNYALNDYPSLAKALKYTSLEIIGENKRLWSHSLTTRSYGFSRLIDDIAPDGLNQDSIIFNRAEKEIKKLKQPFFLFLTTISMHDPYDTHKVTDTTPLPIPTDDERDREFLERLRHFDRSLGRFLTSPTIKDIIDQSVIVILGDHEIRASKISERLHDQYVPFIILNSPVTYPKTAGSTQIDVFPTILDMLGCRYEYLSTDYTGLGQSLFSPDALSGTGHEPTDVDFEISEMIIKGNPAEMISKKSGSR